MVQNKNPAPKGSQPDHSSAGPSMKPIKILVAKEDQHADDELIYPHKFPFVELIPGWDKFDANTKNPVLNKSLSEATTSLVNTERSGRTSRTSHLQYASNGYKILREAGDSAATSSLLTRTSA
jgi:hypothetical protein